LFGVINVLDENMPESAGNSYGGKDHSRFCPESSLLFPSKAVSPRLIGALTPALLTSR
jgi:hypothetical protein